MSPTTYTVPGTLIEMEDAALIQIMDAIVTGHPSVQERSELVNQYSNLMHAVMYRRYGHGVSFMPTEPAATPPGLFDVTCSHL